MAALICESLSKLCGSCCNCLTVPCQACSECCSKVVCSPFFPYLAVTAILNIPPAIWGVQALSAQCNESSWLWINGGLCIVHLVASFYIVTKIQEQQQEQQEQHQEELVPAVIVGDEEQPAASPSTHKATTSDDNDNNKYHRMGGSEVVASVIRATPMASVLVPKQETEESGQANSYQRMGQVLCYDPGVAVYICLAIVWLIWLTVGMSQVLVDHDEMEGVCDSVQKWIMLSLTLGMLYSMLVCCTFACSLLCLNN